ncbi:hypothetical protein MSG28_013370 [Choristoneura fumiferana]|uniref:Uncharacterized protein n=1 Tax=Choristoneura fumiferana TaxID=7141 RepID=A0ACC0KTL3_CHOFU|nr:hypothetical protein MSG28_013370 [Choristoneura fumiferana]
METKVSVTSLINEVRKRQCLWNKKDDYYKNRVYVDKVWDEVAEALDRTKDQIKVKWRNLRDQFHRELKKNPVSESGSPEVDKYGGKWAYYDMLTFLKDHITVRPAEDVRADAEDDDSFDNVGDTRVVIKRDIDFDEEMPNEVDFLDPLDHNDDTSDSMMTPLAQQGSSKKIRLNKNLKRVKMMNVQRQMEIPRRMHRTSVGRELDEDLHFALSIVPYLKRLDPLRKLIVRNEIQNLLIGELLSDSQTTSKPFHSN